MFVGVAAAAAGLTISTSLKMWQPLLRERPGVPHLVALAALGIAFLAGAVASARPAWSARVAPIIRAAVIAGAVLCLAVWVLFQDFGFFGGLGTDPNSMIPFIVLASAGYLALTRVRPAPPVLASPAPAAPAPRGQCA